MAHANTTLSDEWAMFNNVAGIAGQSHYSAVAGVENRYDISSFTSVSAE